MYWDITYKLTKTCYGVFIFTVKADTYEAAIGMFKYIKGDSFYIVDCKLSS
jgi:hypothetical protein